MKKLLTLFVISQFLALVPLNAQWQALSGPVLGKPTSIVNAGKTIFLGFTDNPVSDLYRLNSSNEWESIGLHYHYSGNSLNVYQIWAHDSAVLIDCGNEFYKSTDYGTDWYVNTMALQGFSPNYKTFFVDNKIQILSGDTLFFSSDGGDSWEINKMNLTGINIPNITSILKRNGSIYILSTDIFVSKDNGVTWTPGVDIASLNGALNKLLVCSDGVIASGSSSIYKVYDGYDTWSEYTPQLLIDNNDNITTITTNHLDVLLTTQNGQYIYSTDGGVSWDKFKENFQGQATVTSIINNEYYVGFLDAGLLKEGLIVFTWVPYNNGLANANVTAFLSPYLIGTDKNLFILSDLWREIPSVSSAQVTAITKTDSTDIVFTNLGIYRKTPGMDNWSFASNKGGIKSVMVKDSLLYAAYNDAILIFYSKCNNFQFKNNGLSNNGVTVNDFILANGIFFAATTGGVYSSNDNGDNWSLLGNLTKELIDVDTLAGQPVVTDGQDIYLYNGASSSWEKINGKLDVTTQITAIVSYYNNLIVGSNNNGVYFTQNLGLNWKSFNDAANPAIPNNINILQVIGNYLVAGTKTGLYQRYLQDITDVGVNPKIMDNSVNIFPNPASEFVNITNIGPDKPIEIFNSMGERIYNGKESKVDISKYIPGLYFIRTMGQVHKFLKY